MPLTLSPTPAAPAVARRGCCRLAAGFGAKAPALSAAAGPRRAHGQALPRRPARHAAVGAAATAAVDASARPGVVVTFTTTRKLAYGEVLKVVGSAPELGRWDAARAPAMKWAEGDRWSLTLALPAGRHEFKVAVVSGDRLVGYEDGPNRTLQVSEADAKARKAYSIACQWGGVASWLESLLPGEEEGRSEYHSSFSHYHNQHHNDQQQRDWDSATAEELRAELAQLRRQLASAAEEAAAFGRACESLRAERDALAGQLAAAQQQLAGCQEEKHALAAAAAKSERNIQLLRQVGHLLSNMND